MIEARYRVQRNEASTSSGDCRPVSHSLSWFPASAVEVLPVRAERFHVLWGDVESSSSPSDRSLEKSDFECEVQEAGGNDRSWMQAALLRTKKKLLRRSINPEDITFADESDDSSSV